MTRDEGESATYDDHEGMRRRPARSCLRSACGCEYDPVVENLDYDYGYDDSKRGSKPQPMPRMRSKGEFYVDSFNGEPWGCSFGTGEEVRSHTYINWIVGPLFLRTLPLRNGIEVCARCESSASRCGHTRAALITHSHWFLIIPKQLNLSHNAPSFVSSRPHLRMVYG